MPGGSTGSGHENQATVEQVRFLCPDVASVDVVFTMRQKDGTPWRGVQRSLVGMNAVRDAGAWSIAVFRNQVPFERPAAGPVERSLETGASRA